MYYVGEESNAERAAKDTRDICNLVRQGFHVCYLDFTVEPRSQATD
jgi:hypothetical protein